MDTPMRDLDPVKQHMLEATSRVLTRTIGFVLQPMAAGFALFLFTGDGPELVYSSNADRTGMVRVLQKFIDENLEVPVDPAKTN